MAAGLGHGDYGDMRVDFAMKMNRAAKVIQRCAAPLPWRIQTCIICKVAAFVGGGGGGGFMRTKVSHGLEMAFQA